VCAAVSADALSDNERRGPDGAGERAVQPGHHLRADALQCGLFHPGAAQLHYRGQGRSYSYRQKSKFYSLVIATFLLLVIGCIQSLRV
ncbi:MAG: hypothetical protein ACK56F_02665, partial [bacterium]